MKWLFWVLVFLSPLTLLGLAVVVSFVCGLFDDPDREPISNPKDGWD